jgi:hypothetical protein
MQGIAETIKCMVTSCASTLLFLQNKQNTTVIPPNPRKRKRVACPTTTAAGTLLTLLELDGSRHKDPGFIYMLREREFIKTRENVFKVGKTREYKQRFASYPKHSHVVMMYFTSDMSTAERNLLSHLSTIEGIRHRKDIGREYFECDEIYMKRLFIDAMLIELKIAPSQKMTQ